MTDYYATLGIAKNATGEEIKKAWRRAAQMYHPDATHDSTTARLFLTVKEAYETLSDPAKRAVYDRKLEAERRNREKATPEAYSIQDIPWIREDSLILTYVKDDGRRLVLNTNALHEYLSDLPLPIRLSVANRLGELLAADYIYRIVVSETMFVMVVKQTWFDAGKVHSLRIPWNEGFWEPDYSEKKPKRHVWTNTHVDPRIPFSQEEPQQTASDEQRRGRTGTPPPPVDEKFRQETIRTTPTVSRPTKTLDEHQLNTIFVVSTILSVLVWRKVTHVLSHHFPHLPKIMSVPGLLIEGASFVASWIVTVFVVIVAYASTAALQEMKNS